MKPKIKTTCTKLQLHLLSFCLLCLSGKTRCDGNGPAVVTVEQGSDVLLPCSLSTKENIESKLFDWKKPDGGQKEVFYYDAGIHYNNERAGQSEQFKDRVFHFQEELKRGNASIIIRNAMVADSGNYTCDFPRLQTPQTFHIELVVEPVVVTVKEDRDALLPCSLSTKENISQGYFDWNKVAQNNEKQKEVFQYLEGRHSPNFGSQDHGFKDRVFHFQEELEHGNASIIIRNTTATDSGDYTCTFPESRRTFHIKLVVDGVLKDRSNENIKGAVSKPNIRTLDETDNRALLQCEVHGHPEPEVEWMDSAGNKLPAQKSLVKERDEFFITLNTTVTKNDHYRCVATQKTINHQLSTETFVRINEPVVVTVKEDRDALLPCSLSTKENISQGYFDWNKVAQNNGKKVFQYLNGRHSNTGYGSQDDGFKGRVSHFQEELEHGNISIIIRNTKMADSGVYTCTFPEPRQTFHIKLLVDCVLKDRTPDKKPGTCPKPNLRILRPTDDGVLLQCEVRGAFPKPKVELKDSSGNNLPAKEPQVTARGGSYDIILQTTVTKTDNYSCVCTQEEICHQISADTVPVNVETGNSGSGAHSSGSTGWIVAGVLGVLLIFVIVGGVCLVYEGCITLNCNQGSPTDPKEGLAVPLKSQPSGSQEAPDPET